MTNDITANRAFVLYLREVSRRADTWIWIVNVVNLAKEHREAYFRRPISNCNIGLHDSLPGNFGGDRNKNTTKHLHAGQSERSVYMV